MSLRLLVGAVVLVLSSGIPRWAAGAHVEVVEAEPAPSGETTEGTDEIRLTMVVVEASEPIEVVVSDPDGVDRVVAEPTSRPIEGSDALEVAVEVEPLRPGRHVVRWAATSSDGDGVTEGSYPFTAEPRAGSGPGLWLLWAVAIGLPALVLLRPGRRRSGARS